LDGVLEGVVEGVVEIVGDGVGDGDGMTVPVKRTLSIPELPLVVVAPLKTSLTSTEAALLSSVRAERSTLTLWKVVKAVV
jgi:hypothetical protein